MLWLSRTQAKLAAVLIAAGPALPQTAVKLPPAAALQVNFDQHVKPILASKCFGCHGATQQQSGLRLDRRQNALRGGDYGLVIVPGKSAESKLILRLVGADFGLQMPPTGPLSSEEIGVLRAWIDQGPEFPAKAIEDAGRISKPTDPKVSALLAEIRKSNLPGVRKMASNASRVNGRDENGATLLMHAALYGDADLLRFLLERGADPKAKSGRGATALHWAIVDIEKVRLLLRQGVDVNAKTTDGRSPLLLAASQPSGAEIVELLLERGADPKAKDIAGRTPLMAAASFGNLPSMRALIAKGAELNAVTQGGSAAIMDAARSRNPGAVQLLIESGADVNVKTKRNGTAVAAAASYGDSTIVKMLVDKGARIDVIDERGYSPLMYAAYSESMPVEAVRLLLSKGADPKVTGEGESALSLAMKRGDSEIVKLLRKAEGEGK
ncbi:MAG: ankyrin repeat domain-containing protein [Bryobacteraceae bacterium]